MNRRGLCVFLILVIVAVSYFSANGAEFEGEKVRWRQSPTSVIQEFIKTAVRGDRKTAREMILFKELIMKYSKEIPLWGLKKEYSAEEFEEMEKEFMDDCLKKEEWKIISDIGFDVVKEETKGDKATVTILAPHVKGKRKFEEKVHFFLRDGEWKLDILWPMIKVDMLRIHTTKYTEYLDYINDFTSIGDLGPIGVPYIASLLVCGYGDSNVIKHAYFSAVANENIKNKYKELLQSEDKDIRFYSAAVLWGAEDKSCIPVFIALLDAGGSCADYYDASEKKEKRADILIRWLGTIAGKSFTSGLSDSAPREEHLKAIKEKWQQWWYKNKNTFDLKIAKEKLKALETRKSAIEKP